MSRRVLIVHHPADEARAADVAARVRSAGFSVWRSGRDVQVGDSAIGPLDAVLASGDPVLLLLSVAAIGTGLARRVAKSVAYRRAQGAEQRLLLARLEPCDVDVVRDQVDVPVVADCTDGRFGIGLEDLVRALGDPADRWEQALRSYLERLFLYCRAVHPVGIASQRGQAVLPLDELFIPLHATPHLYRQGYDDAPVASRRQLEALPGEDDVDVPLQDALRRADRLHLPGLVVLGEPGSGKTTLLKHFALTCARGHGAADGGAASLGLPPDTVPVLIPLRKLRHPEQGLDAALEEAVQTPELGCPPAFGRWLLERRQLLLLIDGLDEVADQRAREAVSRWLEAALSRLPGSRFVVTSRYAGYQGDSRLDGRFFELHIRDLEDDEAGHFIDTWYRVVEASEHRTLRMALRAPDEPEAHGSTRAAAEAPEEEGELERRERQARGEADARGTASPGTRAGDEQGTGDGPAVADRAPEVARRLAAERAEALKARLFSPEDGQASSLRSLAHNPLMLQIVCLVHRTGRELPRRRADLYEQCIHLLLEMWPLRTERDVRLVAREALPLLQPIAWWMAEHGVQEASLDELMPCMEAPLKSLARVRPDPAAVLETIRGQSGALVSLGQQRYAFLHLSLQEFLAARHAQENLPDGARVRTLAAHFGEKPWREVILLFVGLPGDPPPFDALMRALIAARRLGIDPGLLDSCLQDALQCTPAPFLEALAAQGLDDDTRYRALTALLRLEGWVEHAVTVVREEKPGWWARLWARPGRRVEVRRSGQEIVEAVARSDGEPSKVRQAAVTLLQRAGVDLPPEVHSPRAGVDLPPEVHSPRAGAEQLHPLTGIVLVYVPGGEYLIGSDDFDYEKPMHRVRLAPFWIAKYPVTNDEYRSFLAADGDAVPPAYVDDRRFGDPRQPIVGVSWEDAQRFCRWAGLQLPSESQWEAAARGPDGRRYPWGDDAPTPERANFGSNVGQTTPVDAYPAGAGPFGTFDQAGNVWELVEDVWHHSYDGAPQDGSAWVRDGQVPAFLKDGVKSPEEVRVFRGGSWLDFPGDLRASDRDGHRSGYRRHNLGFRVVLPAAGAR